ncbi:MAG: site-specific integrase [Methylotenera sp.]|nr:site-specific integrase [Methylotenera sp.]
MNNKTRAIRLLSHARQFDDKSIKSVGTLRAYIACLKIFFDWCDTNGVSSSTRSSKQFLVAFLEEKAEIYQQKTLCQHRMALNAAFHKQLAFIPSKLDTVLHARNYQLSELLQLIQHIQVRNAISILICYFAGLRAHELATLQRLNENTRSSTRSWNGNLFAFETNHTIYIVTGKGGLKRHVAIPNELVSIIELRRFPTPKTVRDREIYYQQNYDIGFGKSLSQCFTRSSLKHLGWSTGLHGLRHSYAKNRIKKLLSHGYELEAARLIVSQELGHFRSSVVNCYLR